jgi:putative DNA primase/helicase
MNNDHDLIAYLARVVGYLLTGYVSAEKAFLLWGSGKNGKTTFRETIYRMLGDYSRTGKSSMLTAEERPGAPSPDLAKLKGARLLAINEMTEGAKINEERFKYLNGNDTLNARELHKPPFDFQPTHKTVITTNYKPKIKDTDEGIWRRIELIPFVVQISDEEKIENFREEKLMPELPGILNWALEGLADYRKNGLKPPDKVTRATRDYRNSEDIIAQWFEDCCERSNAKGVQTLASDLLASLKGWTLDQDDMPSSTALGRWLENKGFYAGKSNKGRFWKGIRLKIEEPEERKPGCDGYKDEEDYVTF